MRLVEVLSSFFFLFFGVEGGGERNGILDGIRRVSSD